MLGLILKVLAMYADDTLIRPWLVHEKPPSVGHHENSPPKQRINLLVLWMQKSSFGQEIFFSAVEEKKHLRTIVGKK